MRTLPATMARGRTEMPRRSFWWALIVGRTHVVTTARIREVAATEAPTTVRSLESI